MTFCLKAVFPSYRARMVLISGGTLALFLGGSWVELVLGCTPGVGLWIPLTGLSFALLLISGFRFAPVVLLSTLLSSVCVFQTPLTLEMLVQASFSILVYTLSAGMLRKRLPDLSKIAHTREITLFLLAALLSPLFAALGFTFLWIQTGLVSSPALGSAIFQSWIENALSILVLVPPLVLLAPGGGQPLQRARAWFDREKTGEKGRFRELLPLAVTVFLHTAGILLVLWVVFSLRFLQDHRAWYLLFLPLMWVTLRFGLRGAVLVTLLIHGSSLLVVNAFNTPGSSFENLQIILLLLSVSGLVIGAAMTERKQAEQALRYRLSIEERIAKSSRRFISLGSEKVDEEIRRAMQAIGELCGTDGSHLLLFDAEMNIEKFYEWAAQPARPRAERLKKMSMRNLPWMLARLQQGDVVYIPNLDALPPEAQAEKVYLQRHHLHSMVTVPLLLGRQLVGSLGFHSTQGEKLWREEDIRLISLQAEIFLTVLERRRVEGLARENDRKFRSIVLQSHDGITLVDENGIVIEWNRGIERISGIARSQALGQPIWEVQYQMAPPEHRTPQLLESIRASVLKTHMNGDADYLHRPRSFKIARPDGEERILEALIFPIPTAQGCMIGSILRDVTEARRAEEELRLSRARLAEAEKLAHLGYFRFAIRDGSMEWSDQVFQIAERDIDAPVPDLKGLLQKIHPDDRADALETLNQIALQKQPKECEYRIQARSGRMKTIYSVGQPVLDAQGNVTHIFGTLMDISERKATEERLRQSEARYRAVVEDQTEMISRFLPDGSITFVNEAYCRNFGQRREKLVGSRLIRWIPLDDLLESAPGCSSDQPVTYACQMVLADGLTHWIQWTERPIQDEYGKIVEYQSVGRDISKSKHLEEELRYLSTHDAPTGLYNRAFFEAELSRLQRSRQIPISILMADVNGLKNTNDTLGHAAGDELLKRAASVLAHSFRPEDIVARFGGDEFAVLLPKTDAAAAGEILLRVRANLSLSLRDPKTPPLSLSVGIATSEQGDALLEVLNLADQHMYEDKQHQKESGTGCHGATALPA